MPDMNSELLSVVDHDDRVLDALPRSEIHRRQLRHRAAHILIFNSRRQLFLQQRSLNKDVNPGLWDSSAAGHLDAGESYDVCAVREIREELGVTLELPPQRLFKLPARAATGMEFIQVYEGMHDGPFRLAKDEISAGGWFDVTDIAERVARRDPQLSPGFITIWQRYAALKP